jgi:hypothetical protein
MTGILIHEKENVYVNAVLQGEFVQIKERV